VALVYLVAIVALTGINHFDGVADLGDAIVVHGDAERRRAVMGDTTLGVGGTLALGLVLAGLALAGLGLAELSVGTAVGLVVAAEVGAKLAMATLVALGSPAHEGFGAAVAGETEPRGLAVPLALALPVAIVTWPSTAAVVALVGSLAAATALLWWSRRRLGGVTGDVIGAANELARVVALHAGLVAATSGVDLSRALLATRLPEVVRWTLW
jgi:adenosylcobinamide-GDP ribazoletransferase